MGIRLRTGGPMGNSLLLLRLGDDGRPGGLDPPDPDLDEDLNAGFSSTLRAEKSMRALLDLALDASLTAGAAWNGKHSSRSDHQRHG